MDRSGVPEEHTITPPRQQGEAPSRLRQFEIDGVALNGPSEGFGPLWQKRYRVRLDGPPVSPETVISTWRARFGDFWPEGNRFSTPLTRITPGDLAQIEIDVGGGATLSTGVAVLSANPTSFRLITPEGHIFAGVITFSAFDDGGITVAQSEVLMRASDPIFEVGMVLFGYRREDRFWEQTLTALARSFGATATPSMDARCIDRHFQWRQAKNIRQNALLRSFIKRGTAPATRIAQRVHRLARRQPGDPRP
jgi:hypothetical protein